MFVLLLSIFIIIIYINFMQLTIKVKCTQCYQTNLVVCQFSVICYTIYLEYLSFNLLTVNYCGKQNKIARNTKSTAVALIFVKCYMAWYTFNIQNSEAYLH